MLSFNFFSLFLWSSLCSCFYFCRYIHRELVPKNAFPTSSLPAFLTDWVNEQSLSYMYTGMQIVKFPVAHLLAGGWFLECSRGYVPKEEDDLYNKLVRSAPDVCDVVEELDEDVDVDPPATEKVVPPVKGKKGKRGKKGMKDAPQASTQVTTRSYTRATSQRTSVPDTSATGSPSTAPSIAPPVPIFVAPTPPPLTAPLLEPSSAPSVVPSPTPLDAPSKQAPLEQPPILVRATSRFPTCRARGGHVHLTPLLCPRRIPAHFLSLRMWIWWRFSRYARRPGFYTLSTTGFKLS